MRRLIALAASNARLLSCVGIMSLAAIPAFHNRTVAGEAASGPPLVTRLPLKPPTPGSYLITFDQLPTSGTVGGEFMHQLVGKDYGLSSLTFFMSDVYPGSGNPMLHTHPTEEVFVVLDGEITYVTEDTANQKQQTFVAKGPYVVRIPPRTPHAFVNSGKKVVHQLAVFPSAEFPGGERLAENPLLKKK